MVLVNWSLYIPISRKYPRIFFWCSFIFSWFDIRLNKKSKKRAQKKLIIIILKTDDPHEKGEMIRSQILLMELNIISISVYS